MDKKGYAQNLVDLSDLDTEAPISKNEQFTGKQNLMLKGGSLITTDPDLLDIFSDEKQQKRIEDQFKEEILVEEQKKEEEQEEPEKEIQSCCTIEYYQQFFEVDSKLFLHRFLSSLWPFTTRPFLHGEEKQDISLPSRTEAMNVAEKKREAYKQRYDLYGALWIPTTLILLLSLSSYWLHSDTDHLNRLLSITYITYTFLFAFPLILFGVVKCGLVGEGVHERATKNKIGFYTLLCVYGYSFSAYLVPAILSTLHYVILKWCLILAATFTSLWMLNKQVGVLAQLPEGQKMGKGVLTMRLMVFVTQLAFGLLMGFWFLGY